MTAINTSAQRQAALEKANRIRTHRAQLKQEVRSGRLDVAALLDDPGCATMKTIDLLILVPRVGRVRAGHALRRAGISPSRPLGQLTARQRQELFGLSGDFDDREAA